MLYAHIEKKNNLFFPGFPSLIFKREFLEGNYSLLPYILALTYDLNDGL